MYLFASCFKDTRAVLIPRAQCLFHDKNILTSIQMSLKSRDKCLICVQTDVEDNSVFYVFSTQSRFAKYTKPCNKNTHKTVRNNHKTSNLLRFGNVAKSDGTINRFKTNLYVSLAFLAEVGECLGELSELTDMTAKALKLRPLK